MQTEETGKQAIGLGTFARVDGPIQNRSIACDAEEDGMRIICGRSCLDNIKCGAVVYNHHDKLKDVDQDESTIRISPLEAKHTLNDFVRKTEMPP
jgi:hypothetical protein